MSAKETISHLLISGIEIFFRKCGSTSEKSEEIDLISTLANNLSFSVSKTAPDFGKVKKVENHI